ncbi:spermidine/putrescine ABC transporter permease PotB [Enterobacter bugandensis]|uniref:Spermidine/putrescine ABC transporter permease PotB n=1 Tax=Enterobacter bugandensis TaxID=881260 RepID=A0AA42PVD6_9ENTR|nr:spermidine/putrescine ABC transporter permease PotB [Enterobacter bugandensis]MDH1321414.1 spermidine/putrescine ABC transporter permease PotB [Enterobacter bugandensis]
MKITSECLQKLVVGGVITWLTVFVFIPTAMVVFSSLLTRDDTSLIKLLFTTENYQRIFDPLYSGIFIRSFILALSATLGCLLVGYPFAFILSRKSKRVQSILLFLLIVPFWTNSLIRIYAFKLFLSVNGYLNDLLLWTGIIKAPMHILYHPQAVILGLMYVLIPFMVMPLYASIDKVDNTLLEAARDLGARKMSVFTRIILPLTMPGIISGCLLVFIPATGMFYVADMMGGAKNLLIGNVIKDQFLTIRDWPFGSAITTVLMLVMGVLLLLYYRVSLWISGYQRGKV